MSGELGSPFFAKRIQNEFCGAEQSTLEPAEPCKRLRLGRWVYERDRTEPLSTVDRIATQRTFTAHCYYWLLPIASTVSAYRSYIYRPIGTKVRLPVP